RCWTATARTVARLRRSRSRRPRTGCPSRSPRPSRPPPPRSWCAEGVRVLEIETLAELDRRVDAGATVARGWHVQSVDLRERTDVLARLDLTGTVFLGC